MTTGNPTTVCLPGGDALQYPTEWEAFGDGMQYRKIGPNDAEVRYTSQEAADRALKRLAAHLTLVPVVCDRCGNKLNDGRWAHLCGKCANADKSMKGKSMKIAPSERDQTVIGSSEIAAIVGLSPWMSPFELAAEKKGLAERKHREEMSTGKDLEQAVAKIWARREGKQIEWLDRTVKASFNDWLVATPDFRFKNASEKVGYSEGGEVKTVGYHRDGWGEPGTDEIPEHYLVQTQVLMAVCGWDITYVPAFFSRDEIPTFVVNRDDELIRELVEQADKFRTDYLLTDKMPPITAPGEVVDSYLRKRFPGETAVRRKATPEEAAMAGELVRVRREYDALELRKGSLEAQLKVSIGEAEGIESPDFKITWRLAKGYAKTDWKGVAADAVIPKEIIERHTSLTAGSRRFLLTANGGKK